MRPELTYPADVATHVFCSGRVICSEEKVHKDAFRAREVGLWVPRAGSQMFPGASSTNRPSDRLDGITAGDDGEVLRAIQHMEEMSLVALCFSMLQVGAPPSGTQDVGHSEIKVCCGAGCQF